MSNGQPVAKREIARASKPQQRRTGDQVMIRRGVPTDSPRFAELVTELGYPTSSSEMTARLSGLLGDPTYAVFAAEFDGRIAGVAAVAVHRYFEKNGLYARLVALVVSQANQRVGIGSALVRVAEAWAREQGAADMIVTSGNQRAGAHKFYHNEGYAGTGLRFTKSLMLSAG